MVRDSVSAGLSPSQGQWESHVRVESDVISKHSCAHIYKQEDSQWEQMPDVPSLLFVQYP